MGRAKKSGAPDLETTRESFAAWRRQHGGPGRRIPASLWIEAGELARVHGIARTARELRVDATRLGKVSEQTVAIAPRRVEPEAFVELGRVGFGAAVAAAVVEFVGREGDRLRVQVDASAVDLVGLAQAFWSRQP